jgi:hypothetical protein
LYLSGVAASLERFQIAAAFAAHLAPRTSPTHRGRQSHDETRDLKTSAGAIGMPGYSIGR